MHARKIILGKDDIFKDILKLNDLLPTYCKLKNETL